MIAIVTRKPWISSHRRDEKPLLIFVLVVKSSSWTVMSEQKELEKEVLPRREVSPIIDVEVPLDGTGHLYLLNDRERSLR